ncbi:MAG: hypothetical protein COB35_06000 [Gammaproteobacteria bacterium]|nr:MAG: hypothetical protein COB35_06000 [Gammaproteobacteria bacterium]
MKNIILIISLITAVTLTGCKLTGSVECHKGDDSVGCSGEVETNALINYFTSDDFQSLDVSKYNFKLTGADVTNNQVKLSALDSSNNALDTKDFAVTKRNGRYYFTSPQDVKDWSYNFIDIASNINLLVPTTNESESSDFILRNEDAILAATSWTSRPHINLPTHRK